MNEDEIREILEKYGYTLDKVVRFKNSDRIRWHSEDLNVSLNLGKKIEDIATENFAEFVLEREGST